MQGLLFPIRNLKEKPLKLNKSLAFGIWDFSITTKNHAKDSIREDKLPLPC